MKKMIRSLMAALLCFAGCLLLMGFVENGTANWDWTVHGTQVFSVLHDVLASPVKFMVSLLIGAWAGLSVLFRKHGFLLFVCCISLAGYSVWWVGPELNRIVLGSIEEQKIETAAFQAQQELETMDAQTIEMEGLPPIRFVSDENITQEYAGHFADSIRERIPAYLFDKCSSIIVMDENYFSQEETVRSAGNVVGFASSSDMAVRLLRNDMDSPYIDLSMPDKVLMPDDYYAGTLAHELGHLEDYQKAYGQDFLSDTPEFTVLYEKEGKTLNEYGASTPAEYFAEAVKYYVLYPQDLANRAPETFSYMQKLFGGREL